MPGYGARLITVAAVKGRLAAASLVFREIDGIAEAFDSLRHCHPDLWKQLIHDARDEQRNPFGHAKENCSAAGAVPRDRFGKSASLRRKRPIGRAAPPGLRYD